MTLLTCPECQGQVSSAATECVHCGYPLDAATEAVETPPRLDEETRAEAISLLGARPPRTRAKTLAGVFGGVLALATFMLTAAADPDGATLVLVSATGIVIALALYWFGRGRRGYPLRWYVTVPLSVAGSVTAFAVFVAMVYPGDPESMGTAVGAGIVYGLLLGTAASSLLYGLRGSTPR